MKRWLLRVALALLVVSVGCLACLRGEPAPDWGPSTQALKPGELAFGGLTRHYLWFQPQGDGPFPLVLALHGRYGDGAGQEKMTGLSRVAEKEGFIVVFPDGYQRSWNDARQVGPAAEKGLDDTAFLVALADDFIAHHRADPRRVYAAGLSNGAMMSLTLACRAAARFAGVFAVAGQWPSREACQPAEPISVALVLGDHDPLVPYAGGEVAKDRGAVLSGEQTLALFAHLDGCAEGPERSALKDLLNDGTTTTVERFSGCSGGAEVRLYTVVGGGHTWPGGWQYLAERLVGKTSRDWSASEEMWAFLKDKHR